MDLHLVGRFVFNIALVGALGFSSFIMELRSSRTVIHLEQRPSSVTLEYSMVVQALEAPAFPNIFRASYTREPN